MSTDTIHVALPTGEKETDRANVQAAFDAVQPGGTVQLAPGTYLLGAGARLTVPDVTVLGHTEGTVLRGCDPEAFEIEDSAIEEVVFGCTGLYVQAERQTIRRLTFEYTWHGIVVGLYPTTAQEAAFWESGTGPPAAYPAGGQRIEGNTFRAIPPTACGYSAPARNCRWSVTTTSSTFSTPSASTARRSTSSTTASP